MKPGPIGTFRATCKRLREDHSARHDVGDDVFCSETFDTFPEAEAHMKAVHPKAFREQRRSEPKMITPRKKPFGAPAVKYENQAITPGTRFTYKGYDCQIIGAASATRTRYLAWFPDDIDPSRAASAARRHYEIGKDEIGMWTWELTAPTTTVLKALAETKTSD